MRRRTLIHGAAAGVGTLATTRLVPAGAQDPAPVSPSQPFRIYLVTWRGSTDTDRGFLDYLRRRRIPVEVIHRDAGRDQRRLPAFVDEIREIRPDLVFTWGTTVAQNIIGRYDSTDPARHVGDVPIVFTNVTNPIQAGIITDLEPTGRNLTGSIFIAPMAAQLSTLTAYRPIRRLGVIYNPLEVNSVSSVADLRAAAPEFGLTLIERPVEVVAGLPERESVPDTVAAIAARGAEFLYLPSDSFLSRRSHDLTHAAAMHRLPTFAGAEGTLTGSLALMGLVSRYYNIGRLAGRQAERILVGGEAPGSMPIESLTRFSFILNMAAARELEAYPPMLMLRFAEVL